MFLLLFFLIKKSIDTLIKKCYFFPAMNDKENKLIEFALRVLDTLENDKEWSSDTTDEIANLAQCLDLAFTDYETMLFTKNKSLLV